MTEKQPTKTPRKVVSVVYRNKSCCFARVLLNHTVPGLVIKTQVLFVCCTRKHQIVAEHICPTTSTVVGAFVSVCPSFIRPGALRSYYAKTPTLFQQSSRRMRGCPSWRRGRHNIIAAVVDMQLCVSRG